MAPESQVEASLATALMQTWMVQESPLGMCHVESVGSLQDRRRWLLGCRPCLPECTEVFQCGPALQMTEKEQLQTQSRLGV